MVLASQLRCMADLASYSVMLWMKLVYLQLPMQICIPSVWKIIIEIPGVIITCYIILLVVKLIHSRL